MKHKTCLAVLEYAEHGNLHDYLSENGDLNWIQKIEISKDIASGLEYLHDTVEITHRKLSTKTILVNDGNVKISNPIFYELNDGTLSSVKELIGFTDPELLRDINAQFTKSSDIYSLGCVMWSISSGKFPFENFTNVTDLICRIVSENIRENPVDGTPQSYIDLYQKCWGLSTNERPSAKEVYNQLEIMLQEELLNNLQESSLDNDKILKLNRFRKNLQERSLVKEKILKVNRFRENLQERPLDEKKPLKVNRFYKLLFCCDRNDFIE